VGDEPADVAGYADLHPKFPHESTADQWFSESQFESYRRLGEYTIEKALSDYEDAKAVWASARGGDQPSDAVRIVEHLREAGITVGRPDLRPNLAGVMLWQTRTTGQRDEREFLMVESSGGGSWVLPKGHIERGESVKECALRELREEAGITLRDRDGESVVIADRFTRRGKTEHCHYVVWERKPTVSTEQGSEDRRSIWVTADEYEQALQARTGASGSDRPKRKGAGNGYARHLIQAREFYGELLWLFDEANRRLDADARSEHQPSPRR
jgi:8-oxo-dGTP pyrophosphatase MutT (NUDIX family)